MRKTLGLLLALTTSPALANSTHQHIGEHDHLFGAFRLDLSVMRADGVTDRGFTLSGNIGGDDIRLGAEVDGGFATDGALDGVSATLWIERTADDYRDWQWGARADEAGIAGFVGVTDLLTGFIAVEARAFLAEEGTIWAELRASTEWHLTQTLVLEPEVEILLAAHDSNRRGLVSGLTSAEAGLRLYWQVTPHVTPWLGLSHERNRAEGDGTRWGGGLLLRW